MIVGRLWSYLTSWLPFGGQGTNTEQLNQQWQKRFDETLAAVDEDHNNQIVALRQHHTFNLLNVLDEAEKRLLRQFADTKSYDAADIQGTAQRTFEELREEILPEHERLSLQLKDSTSLREGQLESLDEVAALMREHAEVRTRDGLTTATALSKQVPDVNDEALNELAKAMDSTSTDESMVAELQSMDTVMRTGDGSLGADIDFEPICASSVAETGMKGNYHYAAELEANANLNTTDHHPATTAGDIVTSLQVGSSSHAASTIATTPTKNESDNMDEEAMNDLMSQMDTDTVDESMAAELRSMNAASDGAQDIDAELICVTPVAKSGDKGNVLYAAQLGLSPDAVPEAGNG